MLPLDVVEGLARLARGRSIVGRSERLDQLHQWALGQHAEAFDHVVKLADVAGSKQEFLADARTLLTRATAHKDLLLEHGLREDLIDKLTADLAAYDQHSAAADAGLRAHTGARSELTAIASELIRMVKQLDGMMLPRIREVPELGGGRGPAPGTWRGLTRR